MRKLNIEQLENVQGGTFIGTEITSCTPKGVYYDEEGNEYVLYYLQCKTFYFFWIPISSQCDDVPSCSY